MKLPSWIKASSILSWAQLAANVATALALLFAGYQFYVGSKYQNIQNSLHVLNEGLELQQQYQAGKAEARDVVAFYYRMYVARDFLDAQVTAPLEHSMCSTMTQDPRLRQYWAHEDTSFYIHAFVQHMQDIRTGKRPCS